MTFISSIRLSLPTTHSPTAPAFGITTPECVRTSLCLARRRLYAGLLLFLALIGSTYAEIVIPAPGVISSVAGTSWGPRYEPPLGDGGAATSARLYYPTGVAVDSAGNIYIADRDDERIRKVTASTGIITTVAGNGTVGYSGDGGAATSAEINLPWSVAVDSTGNIYFADYGNSRIRKVTVSTGIITTVAGNGTAGYSGDGGAATSAKINYPEGVTVDSSGNIYIADYNNNRVRKVTVSTGKISTVAGNGTQGFSGDGGAATSAEMYAPGSVALDSSGNIYIGDRGNNRIRKVTVATGVISTVAGNGTAGSSGDGGPATSAELDDSDAAVDTDGNIYTADILTNRVREVTAATGIITTVAGDGTAGYSGDGGPATSAEINWPLNVAVDTGGNIYIADFNNNRIRAVGGGGISAFINPKYVVVGVTYAPPGSSSTVQYTNTTSVGSTTTITGSFQSDVGYSVSVSAGIGIPAGGIVDGGAGVKLTFTESTDYTQGSNSSKTVTISKASTIAYTTPGTPTAAPVNSDYDYIWLWLNPELLITYRPNGNNPATLKLTGYAFDPTDPASGEPPPPPQPYISGPDIVEVQVGCLDGHFSCPSTLVITNGIVTSGILARSWANGEYQWASGQGPGLTTTDIANILTFDLLVPSNNYTLLNSFPSTTSDGRFTKEPYPPNPIQYPVGGATEMYSTVQTDTQSVASGASTTIKQAFGVSEQFGTNFFDIFSSTTTMTQSLTLTWNYTWLNTLTSTTTLTDALSVKGPPDPPPPYTGPVEFIAYQDNLFGTFAFVPVN
jgi:hypothetical protein